MSSLDDLFKKPSLPNNKRKSDAQRDPREIYKATKLSVNGHAKSNGQPSVEDVEDDVEAGPELPPEEEEAGLDDEEGRFFGGGITRNTAEVLDYMDDQDPDETKAEKIDIAWLRKLALSFEKKISKNAELRAKFEDTPAKFMSSEADLDAEIKALSILSEHPELYEEFSKLGCVASLVSLMSHENTDIAIDVIEIVSELTDEDVSAQQHQWDHLVGALLDAQLLDLLHENLLRFDESIESDIAGVYHVLKLLENLSSSPTTGSKIGKETKLLPWLLSRIQKPEQPVTQNKQYAAEILAILLQSSPENRTSLTSLNGIDTFLQLLSPYRKRDPPKGTDEEEYVENVFDCLTCCVDDTDAKSKFLEAEGMELCLIMLREGKKSRYRALRVLDHVLGGPDGGICCETLVEAGGLKKTFSLFMHKEDAETTEHLLGIFYSMFRTLPLDEAPRIRFLAKFMEKNYRAIERLMSIRKEYASKLADVDAEIKHQREDVVPVEDQAEMEDQWLSARLDGGLHVIQTIAGILLWLMIEDDGAKREIKSLLERTGEDLGTVTGILQEQLEVMSDSDEEQDPALKDMIETLLKYV